MTFLLSISKLRFSAASLHNSQFGIDAVSHQMKQVPKFEDSRRGDAGRDGGGIYRHIARDTRIPNILTKGDYSTLRWREVCSTLYSKPGEENKLKVK